MCTCAWSAGPCALGLDLCCTCVLTINYQYSSIKGQTDHCPIRAYTGRLLPNQGIHRQITDQSGHTQADYCTIRAYTGRLLHNQDIHRQITAQSGHTQADYCTIKSYNILCWISISMDTNYCLCMETNQHHHGNQSLSS